MINFLRLWRNRRDKRLAEKPDTEKTREMLEMSGMRENELQALFADEHLPSRIRARVREGVRQHMRSESQTLQLPSLARAAAAFTLLTAFLLGFAWTVPRFRAMDSVSRPVEPAPVGAACQPGDAACRVSAEPALRTLVHVESVESQK